MDRKYSQRLGCDALRLVFGNSEMVAVVDIAHERDATVAILCDSEYDASADIYSGPWLDARACFEFGSVLTDLGTRMQDGESVAEALRGLAGEQTE